MIRAVKEPKIKDNDEVEVIIAEYDGFSGNICEYEEPATPTGTDVDSHGGWHQGNTRMEDREFHKLFVANKADANCSKTDSGYRIFVQKDTNFIDNAWVDITAKLRPR